MPLGTVDFQADADGVVVNLSILATGMTKVVSVERLTPIGAQKGTGVIVRGSEDVPAAGGWNGADFEAPPGVLLEYLAVVEGDSPADQATVRVSTDGVIDYGGDFIMPVGFPQLGFTVVVEYGGIADLSRSVQRDVIPVLNRADPVVVSFGRKMFEGVFTFLTLTDAERNAFLIAMRSPVIMFAARPGFGFRDPVFLSPGTVNEGRTVGLGREQSRRWSVDFTQVSRPPAFYGDALPSSTWQDHLDLGATWQSVFDQNIIWFDLAGFRA